MLLWQGYLLLCLFTNIRLCGLEQSLHGSGRSPESTAILFTVSLDFIPLDQNSILTLYAPNLPSPFIHRLLGIVFHVVHRIPPTLDSEPDHESSYEPQVARMEDVAWMGGHSGIMALPGVQPRVFRPKYILEPVFGIRIDVRDQCLDPC